MAGHHFSEIYNLVLIGAKFQISKKSRKILQAKHLAGEIQKGKRYNFPLWDCIDPFGRLGRVILKREGDRNPSLLSGFFGYRFFGSKEMVHGKLRKANI